MDEWYQFNLKSKRFVGFCLFWWAEECLRVKLHDQTKNAALVGSTYDEVQRQIYNYTKKKFII
jgi:hypothetical protein